VSEVESELQQQQLDDYDDAHTWCSTVDLDQQISDVAELLIQFDAAIMDD